MIVHIWLCSCCDEETRLRNPVVVRPGKCPRCECDENLVRVFVPDENEVTGGEND